MLSIETNEISFRIIREPIATFFLIFTQSTKTTMETIYASQILVLGVLLSFCVFIISKTRKPNIRILNIRSVLILIPYQANCLLHLQWVRPTEQPPAETLYF